jgi:hypothetical protein
MIDIVAGWRQDSDSWHDVGEAGAEVAADDASTAPGAASSSCSSALPASSVGQSTAASAAAARAAAAAADTGDAKQFEVDVTLVRPQDLVQDGRKYWYLPGAKHPLGRITDWARAGSSGSVSYSATCQLHGSQCRAIFSSAMAERWGVDPVVQLKKWLILGHVDKRAKTLIGHKSLSFPRAE